MGINNGTAEINKLNIYYFKKDKLKPMERNPYDNKEKKEMLYESLINDSKKKKNDIIEKIRELMEENILREESYHFGKIDGIKEGIEQGMEKIVINMVKDRVPFKLISKYTKLSISKIKDIVNSNNKIKI